MATAADAAAIVVDAEVVSVAPQACEAAIEAAVLADAAGAEIVVAAQAALAVEAGAVIATAQDRVPISTQRKSASALQGSWIRTATAMSMRMKSSGSAHKGSNE